jgi:hypothetical protein
MAAPRRTSLQEPPVGTLIVPASGMGVCPDIPVLTIVSVSASGSARPNFVTNSVSTRSLLVAQTPAVLGTELGLGTPRKHPQIPGVAKDRASPPVTGTLHPHQPHHKRPPRKRQRKGSVRAGYCPHGGLGVKGPAPDSAGGDGHRDTSAALHRSFGPALFGECGRGRRGSDQGRVHRLVPIRV